MTTKNFDKINSVLGPISPEKLGITLPHEHLFCDLSAWFSEPKDDVGLKFYTSSHLHAKSNAYAQVFEAFMESMYEGEWLLIGRYLSTVTRHEDWSDAEFKKIRKKAYGFLLRDGYL